MHKTTIKITFTKITFFDTVEKVAKFIHVPEKLTVKQSKEFIPTDSKFITKETETDSFEISTELLLELKDEQTN